MLGEAREGKGYQKEKGFYKIQKAVKKSILNREETVLAPKTMGYRRA